MDIEEIRLHALDRAIKVEAPNVVEYAASLESYILHGNGMTFTPPATDPATERAKAAEVFARIREKFRAEHGDAGVGPFMVGAGFDAGRDEASDTVTLSGQMARKLAADLRAAHRIISTPNSAELVAWATILDRTVRAASTDGGAV